MPETLSDISKVIFPIAEYYKNSDGKTKKKILGFIFSGKMVLTKGKVASYEFTKPIEVLLNASKVFKNRAQDKRSLMTSCLVWLP